MRFNWHSLDEIIKYPPKPFQNHSIANLCITRAMTEIKTISCGDTTENTASFADHGKDFYHTIKHGTRIQVSTVDSISI